MLYFGFAFRWYKGGADDGDDSVVDRLSDYSVFIDWLWFAEDIFKVVSCFFLIRFAIGIEFLRFIADLLVVRSWFLFPVWCLVVLDK